ncbi:MAG: polyketide synthase [Deltaproteobacteria bacterium]|nr:polyketide synthase [Deltaproteobacteria bacterium]
MNNIIDLNEPIAITGLGCYFPGAPNPKKYWENIYNNKCQIRHLTNNERELGPVYDPKQNTWNKTQTCLGALIEPFEFPYKRFKGLPPSAIHASDPNFKWGLLAAQDAIDDAGLTNQTDKNIYVVLAGNAYSTPLLRDYSDSYLFYQLDELKQTKTFQLLSITEQKIFLEKLNKEYFKIQKKLSVDSLIASMASHLAARITKLNGFTGGHTAVDAACASSFAAIDLAIKRLRAHAINIAVVGGVGEIIPFFYIYCSNAKTLSNEGSFPFDTKASGFVVGEGAGFIVLKRLSQALKENDKIHAIIRGIGASSDGSKTAPWAPSKEGQKLAVLRALKQVPYNICDLQYIECHGTGTRVGDLEEILGIRDLLSKNKTSIAIGSAKGAIGHLLTGAGFAGLFRTILAIQNKTLPPTAGLTSIIEELKKSDLFIPRTPLEWKLPPSQFTRKAMVNSFGFGGTNYNIQLEEFNYNHHKNYPEELPARKNIKL